MKSVVHATRDSAGIHEEARLNERRLVLAAAAAIAATGDAVEVITPWRTGLIREARSLAAQAGARAWCWRSGNGLIVRFASHDDLPAEERPPSGPRAA